MNRIERVKTALEHKEPDRVPTISCMEVQKYIYDALEVPPPKNIYQYLISPFWSRIIDVTAPLLNRIGGFEKSVMEYMVNRIRADIKMGFDATWNIYADIFKIKNSRQVYDIFGRLYKITDDGYGNLDTPMYIRGMFETPEDWRRLNKRDWEAHPEKMYKHNLYIHERFGKDIYIFGSHLYGLFEQTWQCFGFPIWSRLIRKERGFIEEMIEYNKQWYLKCVDASADAGFPGIVYTDDMAYKSGPMLNPVMMEELFGDAFREITARAHRKGLKIVIHTDGNTKKLLPYFISWGFDGQHALEPTANVDLGEFREAVGHRLSLLGHLDIAHVLSHGTRDEVRDNVRDSIRKAGAGGGLLLGPCNSHADIKVENLKWMMEAVEEYGRYPLAV
jgi:hypothetical protein